MNWLSVPTGLILAAAVIPPLLMLYFLRLRRQELRFPSTLLWIHSVEDLRANVPFQRLRPSVLLFLQLLALALIAIAVMQPRIQAGDARPGRTVILIDNSGSMQATDGDGGGTRLDQAKERVRNLIEARYAGGVFSDTPGETMIIAFNSRAEIMSRFTTSKQQLLNAVAAIAPTDAETRLAEALTLARAYTTNVNPDSDRPIAEPATLELFSDGEIADLGDQVLRMEQMIYYPIGAPGASNVAITGVSVDRPYDRPLDVQVFVALANFGATDADCEIELAVNDRVLQITPEPKRVPAAEVDEQGVVLPGRSNVIFTPFRQPDGAVIRVRNLHDDPVAADNIANVIVPPPKRLRVAIVSSRSNVLLKIALEGQSLERLELVSPSLFESMVSRGENAAFDVVILDDWEPETLPPGRYLTFGRTPPVEGLNDYGEGRQQLIISSRSDHPALQYVNLDDVYVERFRLLAPGDDVTTIAEINHSGVMVPAMLEVSRGGAHVIHLTFDLTDSTLYKERAFPNFLVNAIEYLGYARQALTVKGYRPGDVLSASLPGEATRVEVRPPGGTVDVVEPRDPTLFNWGPARRAGLYSLAWTPPGGEPQTQAVAVNAFSETEGLIDPKQTIVLSSTKVEGLAGDAAAYTPLWPWITAFCLFLLTFEWWYYHRKAA